MQQHSERSRSRDRYFTYWGRIRENDQSCTGGTFAADVDEALRNISAMHAVPTGHWWFIRLLAPNGIPVFTLNEERIGSMVKPPVVTPPPAPVSTLPVPVTRATYTAHPVPRNNYLNREVGRLYGGVSVKEA